MSSVIYRKVLVCNKLWKPIGECTVKEAVEKMNSRRSPKSAFKIEYNKDEDGNYDFSSPTEIIPLSWEYWQMIEPREFDNGVLHTPTLKLRIPTVIITSNYDKIPEKTFSATKRNIYHHHGGKCAYTGKKISFNEATIDHYTSRDQWKKKGLPGSPNVWNNLCLTTAKINRLKSNMSPEEFEKKYGYKLQFPLTEPKRVSVSHLFKEAKHPDWNWFIDK